MKELFRKNWQVIVVTLVVSIILMAALFVAIPTVVNWVMAPEPSLALGFDEAKNVYSRIRINSEGQVICAPR